MCPAEMELIRLVAGELDEATSQRLRAHVDSCAVCQTIYREQLALWNALGETDDGSADRDLTSAILRAAFHAGSTRTRLRIAAAVLLAVGGGVALGAALPVHHPDQTAQAPDPQVVTNTLGLDALAQDESGLTAVLAPPDRTQSENKS